MTLDFDFPYQIILLAWAECSVHQPKWTWNKTFTKPTWTSDRHIVYTKQLFCFLKDNAYSTHSNRGYYSLESDKGTESVTFLNNTIHKTYFLSPWIITHTQSNYHHQKKLGEPKNRASDLSFWPRRLFMWPELEKWLSIYVCRKSKVFEMKSRLLLLLLKSWAASRSSWWRRTKRGESPWTKSSDLCRTSRQRSEFVEWSNPGGRQDGEKVLKNEKSQKAASPSYSFSYSWAYCSIRPCRVLNPGTRAILTYEYMLPVLLICSLLLS